MDLETFRQLPENFLHATAIHILEREAQRLQARVCRLEIVAHLGAGLKFPGAEEEILELRLEVARRALQDMKDSIAVLTAERTAKLRRASIKVLR